MYDVGYSSASCGDGVGCCCCCCCCCCFCWWYFWWSCDAYWPAYRHINTYSQNLSYLIGLSSIHKTQVAHSDTFNRLSINFDSFYEQRTVNVFDVKSRQRLFLKFQFLAYLITLPRCNIGNPACEAYLVLSIYSYLTCKLWIFCYVRTTFWHSTTRVHIHCDSLKIVRIGWIITQLSSAQWF